MGRKTFDTIGKPLPDRLNLIVTTKAEKFKEKEIPGALEFTDNSPEQITENLKNKGFETAILGGGAAINSLFLKNNLIDELMLTIEPKLFGSGYGIFDKTDVDMNLELIDIKRLNDNTINIHYKIIK
jgi:dihydrofolate reductase